MEKVRGGVSGGGLMLKPREPSESTVFVPPARDFEVVEHAAGPKNGQVSFFLRLQLTFFSRCALAWSVFRRGEVDGCMAVPIALDLSSRLYKAAGYAELGVEPPTMATIGKDEDES